MGTARQRIAVVGSGISGLCTAHVLSQRHDITLFEAEARLGGHTHTIPIDHGGTRYAIDTGFIVYNDRTYPNFVALLDRLGVATQPSAMSFSVHCDETGLEYNGTSLNALFAQRRNLLRPSFWWMIREILRFNREARELLSSPDDSLTLSAFLERGRYSKTFVRHYLVPMGAAIWSTAPEQMLAFPAAWFVRFFDNHGFLSVDDRPVWRVIQGGSSSYLPKLTQRFAAGIRMSSPVESVRRTEAGVVISVRGRDPEAFDAVVIACHSDQALRMLADPTDAERAVLGAIPYQENTAVLHTDRRFLPRRKLAWAAWNYHLPRDDGRRARPARVSLTYSMNILQSLDAPVEFLVTLNRDADIDPKTILRRITYHHPLYTREGVAAQARHAEISGQRQTYYCGAYWRFGFHEDGVVSALEVCKQFGMALS